MFKLCILVALLGVASAIEIFGDEQSAAVKGKLLCDGKPAAGVVVKLYDEDDTDADDLLEEGKTNANGEFSLSGSTRESTNIDPKLNIYHDCNDLLPCQRKFTIKIGNDYITKGRVAKKVYDAGTINLSGKFSGEKRDCVH